MSIFEVHIMMHQWRDFLTAGTASIDAQGRVQFPEPATPTDCRLFDLSHLGLIAARGADAASFLQGQLRTTFASCRPVTPSSARIAARRGVF
jgi:tRNA-modifying protein YgfZ